MAETRELVGWKTISHALGVNIRTAMKYEQERGLPIQRTGGGRVSIDTTALHAWREHDHNPGEERTFRLLLGPHLTAEVRFLGGDPTAEHIELLRQYLDLTRTALQHK